MFPGLIAASQLANDPGKFAESRRDALKAIARYLFTYTGLLLYYLERDTVESNTATTLTIYTKPVVVIS